MNFNGGGGEGDDGEIGDGGGGDGVGEKEGVKKNNRSVMCI